MTPSTGTKMKRPTKTSPPVDEPEARLQEVRREAEAILTTNSPAPMSDRR
jgi:hypothetical protein